MLMDMCSGIELELRDTLDLRLGSLAVSILQRALLFGPLSTCYVHIPRGAGVHCGGTR